MAASYEIFGTVLNGRIALKGKPSKNFAFSEIGPVSPLPQPDAPHFILDFKRLRLLRKTANANKGLKYTLTRIREKYFHRKGWRICITPVFGNDKDVDITQDYEKVYSLMYDFVDLFCIDTTLRSGDGKCPLEDTDTFSRVLDSLLHLRRCYDDHKPVLVRISPALDRTVMDYILLQCRMGGVEAVMVGSGGKGKTGLEDTLQTVRYLREGTSGRYPIIACIHRLSAESAFECFQAGASLVQAEKRCGKGINKIERQIGALQREHASQTSK